MFHSASAPGNPLGKARVTALARTIGKGLAWVRSFLLSCLIPAIISAILAAPLPKKACFEDLGLLLDLCVLGLERLGTLIPLLKDLFEVFVTVDDLLVLGLEFPGSLVPLLTEASQHTALPIVLLYLYCLLKLNDSLT